MMELPVVSGDQCIAALERAGYQITGIRGSHVRMRRPKRPAVTVPRHSEFDRGALRAILRTAEISVAQFISLLK
jgi:predicted RNA binding protein YcfA (HicA-like mRNA interferase family)